jgi:Bacterial regulatory helix-turn-helix protein, lysR family
MTTTKPPTINPVSVAQALIVAEYLSFRGAARALGIRQSAVSRRVRALEDELGVSLFERYHLGVRVTNAGARFLQQARDALQQLDHASKTAGAAGRGATGQLSIGILSSMAAGFLRELIQGYSERNPDVAIQIIEGASAEHIACVRRRRLTWYSPPIRARQPIATWHRSGTNAFSLFFRVPTHSVPGIMSNGRLFVMSILSSAIPPVACTLRTCNQTPFRPHPFTKHAEGRCRPRGGDEPGCDGTRSEPHERSHRRHVISGGGFPSNFMR